MGGCRAPSVRGRSPRPAVASVAVSECRERSVRAVMPATFGGIRFGAPYPDAAGSRTVPLRPDDASLKVLGHHQQDFAELFTNEAGDVVGIEVDVTEHAWQVKRALYSWLGFPDHEEWCWRDRTDGDSMTCCFATDAEGPAEFERHVWYLRGGVVRISLRPGRGMVFLGDYWEGSEQIPPNPDRKAR